MLTKTKLAKEQKDLFTEFQTLSKPLMAFLAENYHPHVTVILTDSTAELLKGLMASINTDIRSP